MGLTTKLWFSKTVIQLWNVSVISVIIESWINSEFVLLWDVQKMGQQTSNSRIQQIAKSTNFFQQQKRCDLQTCEKVVIGVLAPFPGIAVLQMAQNWWWPNRSKDLLEEPVTCRESPWGRGLGSRPVQHPKEIYCLKHIKRIWYVFPVSKLKKNSCFQIFLLL